MVILMMLVSGLDHSLMSNYNFEDSAAGDWENRGEETFWTETDWKQFLHRQEAQISRFLALYDDYKDRANHLDEIAHEMGWDQQDWGSMEDDEPGPYQPEEESDAENADTDPYTLHRHPVFTVVRALYRWIDAAWEKFQPSLSGRPAPRLIWQFSRSLHEGEFQTIMGLQSLDMGDYLLCVCQIKSSLQAINQSFTLLQEILPDEGRLNQRLGGEIRRRLFDLREINLRVMNDCREEIRRAHDDND